MIISVKSGNHEAEAAVTALLAAMSALKYSLKTCVIQFPRRHGMLQLPYIFTGRLATSPVTAAAADIRQQQPFLPENMGMDAILRYQAINGLTAERFALSVSPILKLPGLLDVVPAMSPVDIAGIKEQVSELIAMAESLYNNIIVIFGDADRHTVAEILKKHEHRNVTCISQGSQIDMGAYRPADYYIINDYDTRSRYSLQYYKKMYNPENVYMLPYNVSFRDSFLSGNALEFIRKNLTTDSPDLKKARIEDANAFFIMQTDALLKSMLGISGEKYADMDICWEHKNRARAYGNKRHFNEFFKDFEKNRKPVKK